MISSGSRMRVLVLGELLLSGLVLAKTPRIEKTAVTYPSAFGVSERLGDLLIDFSLFAGREMPEPFPSALASRAVAGPWQLDPVLQKEVLPEVSATQGANFDGIGAANEWVPSDSNLAVGPNQIVETVNVQVGVFGKNGTLLSGPTNLAELFKQIHGLCTEIIVDPIVLYDRAADRWLIADIGSNAQGTSYAECVAVSKTNDATGSYTLYSYSFGGNLIGYDKLSVWATASNGAYLATYDLNQNGSTVADLCGFDRSSMLAGSTNAAMLCQTTPGGESDYLPSDMDGPTPPVDGTPGLFLSWHNNNPGELYLRKLTLDFVSGTASLSNPTTINVASDNLACEELWGEGHGVCVPQAQTTTELDTLGDRLMFRFAIRHFPDHDRAVVNHAVENGNEVAIRWYEIYDPAGKVTLNQQGTFAPDTTYRWMGSMAEDQNADIALGYSASSSTIHPAIRFTGRVPGDPLGTMETEAAIIQGNGSQTSVSRWGDYTAMQVDPADDCTFWYVDEYEQANGVDNWSTHIGSFAFNGCGGSVGIMFSPEALKFGKIAVGTTSAAKSVTVTNSGSGALSISNIATSGDFAIKAFKATKKITPCVSDIDLSPGASCAVKVTITPTQAGVRTGDLSFTDNAPNSPQSVALSGTGK